MCSGQVTSHPSMSLSSPSDQSSCEHVSWVAKNSSSSLWNTAIGGTVVFTVMLEPGERSSTRQAKMRCTF
jgi:hypothetical protein